MPDALEPRATKYEQGYAQAYAQASRDIANMLQRKGHDAAARLVADGEHRKHPTLAELAQG